MTNERENRPFFIFAGTSEGRELAQWMTDNGIACLVSVATAYGEMVMESQNDIECIKGRMSQEQMEQILTKDHYCGVIDATHPFAQKVTGQIRTVCRKNRIPYYRVCRDIGSAKELELERELKASGSLQKVESMEQAAALLKGSESRILLTTGSKELALFVDQAGNPKRITARVLPSIESMQLCEEAGLEGKQIIAMHGPFSAQMNEAQLKLVQADVLITKETGSRGGYLEKLQAVKQCGCKAVVIENKEKEKQYDEKTIRVEIAERMGITMDRNDRCRIFLTGIGMGTAETLTERAFCVLQDADVIFAAERILNTVEQLLQKRAQKDKKCRFIAKYQKTEVLSWLRQHPECRNAVVAFSGDVGFYSGACAFKTVQEEKEWKDYAVEYIPGISSVVYFAAKIGISWQQIHLCSAHGRRCNVLGEIRNHRQCFFLMTDVAQIRELGRKLRDFDEQGIQVTYGYQLSYPEEIVESGSPKILEKLEDKGLYVLLVEREASDSRCITPGILDEAFQRDKVPMTKEEIREISLCKLRLTENAIVYDIGAGTGSVSIESALLCPQGMIYALEQKPEAVSLLFKNKQLFHVENMQIIQTKAPDAMEKLPPPTHVFIGGSGGNLEQILRAIPRNEKAVRVVINAVSIETIAQVHQLLQIIEHEQLEMIQVSAAKARKIGAYHLMEGLNPVTIISFYLPEKQNGKNDEHSTYTHSSARK